MSRLHWRTALRLLALTFLITLVPEANGYSPFMNNRHGSFSKAPENGTSEQLASPYIAPGGLAALGSKKANKDSFATSQGKNVFEVIYQWKVIDFLYPSLQARNNAIRSR